MGVLTNETHSQNIPEAFMFASIFGDSQVKLDVSL